MTTRSGRAAIGASFIAVLSLLSSACGSTQPTSAVGRPAGSTTTAVSAASATRASAQPTTTLYPPPGPGQTIIATAAVPEVQISEQLPPGAPAAGTPTVDRTTFAPVSVGPHAAVPLPSPTLAVGGRYRTDTGWTITSPTSFGNPAVFLVTEERGPWLKVLVPVRPNDTEGWVDSSQVTLSTIDTSVVITVSTRTLQAFAGGQMIAQTPVVVGAGGTPTPTGRFFVTDYVARDATGSYGPWILPLSGFSQAMDRFSDGVPVIAMHGTNHPELFGQNRSNGCIRMPNAVALTLRARLPLGTPVDIRP